MQVHFQIHILNIDSKLTFQDQSDHHPAILYQGPANWRCDLSQQTLTCYAILITIQKHCVLSME